jgi:hypothetical protein
MNVRPLHSKGRPSIGIDVLIWYPHPSLAGGAVGPAPLRVDHTRGLFEGAHIETSDEEKQQPWDGLTGEVIEVEEAVCEGGTSKSDNWDHRCSGNELGGPRGAYGAVRSGKEEYASPEHVPRHLPEDSTLCPIVPHSTLL